MLRTELQRPDNIGLTQNPSWRTTSLSLASLRRAKNSRRPAWWTRKR